MNGLRASVNSGRCLGDGHVFHQDGLCMIIVLANHHVDHQVTGLTVCSVMFKQPQGPISCPLLLCGWFSRLLADEGLGIVLSSVAVFILLLSRLRFLLARFDLFYKEKCTCPFRSLSHSF